MAGIFALPYLGLQRPKSAAAIVCHEFRFDGRISGEETYSHELGGGLFLRLVPSMAPPNEHGGWVIQVQPEGSNDDYAWPVNPPFHFGNSQWLATGYNETAEQQFSREHKVFFVLNNAEYEKATKLADDALSSSDTEAAGKFLARLPSLRSAVLKFKPLKHETTNESKSVSWMQFSVRVITPSSFQAASGSNTRDVPCPSAD